MNIQPIKQGNNKFCGPAVISSITGITTDEAEKIINSVRNKSLSASVTGVWANELNRAFESLGYKVYHITGVSRDSLYTLMLKLVTNGIYLIYVKDHVVAIEIDGDKRYIIDNHTKKPLNISNSARISQNIQGVVKLEKVK